MKIYVSPKYILLSIALSFLFSPKSWSNEAAKYAEALLGTPYSAFANNLETGGKKGVSCISIVQYALDKLGYSCPEPDFKKYYEGLINQAEELEFGKTGLSDKGVILFNRYHFAVFDKDINENGVIDEGDTIIHARFESLRAEPIFNWTEKDNARPIYAVRLGAGFQCPE